MIDSPEERIKTVNILREDSKLIAELADWLEAHTDADNETVRQKIAYYEDKLEFIICG